METTNKAFDLEEIERGLFYGLLYWAEEASRRADAKDISGAEVAQRISDKIGVQHSVVRTMAGKSEA